MNVGQIGLAAGRNSADEPDEEKPTRKIAIITNRANPTPRISKAELGRAFLKKYKFWASGLRCIPIDRSGMSEIRAIFYDQVLERDQGTLKRYWMQETMTGNAGPPVTVENSTTVKRYIEKLEGGIGYIWEDEVVDSVTVVQITDDSRFAVPPANGQDEEDAAGEKK